MQASDCRCGGHHFSAVAECMLEQEGCDSLCSLLQGAFGKELPARLACLSSAPSKLEEDPTSEPPVSTALAAGVPASGIQFCLLPLLVIKSASPCIP